MLSCTNPRVAPIPSPTSEPTTTYTQQDLLNRDAEFQHRWPSTVRADLDTVEKSLDDIATIRKAIGPEPDDESALGIWLKNLTSRQRHALRELRQHDRDASAALHDTWLVTGDPTPFMADNAADRETELRNIAAGYRKLLAEQGNRSLGELRLAHLHDDIEMLKGAHFYFALKVLETELGDPGIVWTDAVVPEAPARPVRQRAYEKVVGWYTAFADQLQWDPYSEQIDLGFCERLSFPQIDTRETAAATTRGAMSASRAHCAIFDHSVGGLMRRWYCPYAVLKV